MGNTNQYGYGSRGSGVSWLQKMLNKNGFNLTVDGIFGNNNQKDNGLDVDGIAGKNTLASLEGTGSAKASNNTPSNTTPKTANKTTGFAYDDYTKSDVVKEAEAMLKQNESQKPGEFNFGWQAQLDDTIKKILNREEFSYDFNGDALYQQYKDKYIQQGKMALADTMGQASAMTGGYGNSYAQSVGQQAYNAHLEQLNDIIPELYQMAYDKYNREGEDLYNQYAMLGDREAFEYGQHRDDVSDWLTERDYLAGRADKALDFDYGTYIDNRDLAYTDHTNAISDEQWQKEFNEGVRQFNNKIVPTSSQPVVDDDDDDDKPKDDTPTYNSIVNDLNTYIKNGASRSNISTYLRNALNEGYISQEEYNKLKETFLPSGSSGSGGRYTY